MSTRSGERLGCDLNGAACTRWRFEPLVITPVLSRIGLMWPRIVPRETPPTGGGMNG